METTCNRCHQSVQAENTYCPACGLPQLVYSAEPAEGQAQPDRWTDAVRDASEVDWKPAMRIALMLAVPAAMLSSASSPVNSLGIFWIAAAAAWAVVLYVRSQQGPTWVTMGAGARIGLVTGLFAAWLTFSISGGALYVQRFVLHSASQTDAQYKSSVMEMFENATQQSISQMGPADAAQIQIVRAQMETWMLSPWGRAGVLAMGLAAYSVFLLFFAAGGGAVGARLLARVRPPRR